MVTLSSVGEDMKQKEFSSGRKGKSIATMKNSLSVPYKDNNIHLQYDPTILTPKYLFIQEKWKSMSIQRPGCLYSQLILRNSPKTETTQWTNEWIHTMWSIHTMVYHSTTNRNEVLLHDITWMNLKNITLSERSQTEKTPYCMVLFIWNSGIGKIIVILING